MAKVVIRAKIHSVDSMEKLYPKFPKLVTFVFHDGRSSVGLYTTENEIAQFKLGSDLRVTIEQD